MSNFFTESVKVFSTSSFRLDIIPIMALCWRYLQSAGLSLWRPLSKNVVCLQPVQSRLRKAATEQGDHYRWKQYLSGLWPLFRIMAPKIYTDRTWG